MVLIGSSHSLDAFRIKEFLTRNYQPYSYVDLDREADVQDLLDRFHVAITDSCTRLGRHIPMANCFKPSRPLERWSQATYTKSK